MPRGCSAGQGGHHHEPSPLPPPSLPPPLPTHTTTTTSVKRSLCCCLCAPLAVSPWLNATGPPVPHEAQTPASSGRRRPGVLEEPERAPGSSFRHPVSGWWRRRRGRHDHAVLPQEGSLQRKEEEEKAKRETVHQESRRLAAEAIEQARLMFERNKRKKKRKRKLPKGSSPRSLSARAVRTQKYGRHFYCPDPSWCLVLPWFDRWNSSCVSLWMLVLDIISSSPLCCPGTVRCLSCPGGTGNVVLLGITSRRRGSG